MIIFTPNSVIKSADVNLNFNDITTTFTYKHQMLIKGDNAGGAVDSAQVGSPEVAFSGTPTGYGRASGILPVNYAGGTIAVKIYLWSTSTNNQNLTYYVGGHNSGSTTLSSTWNLQSNQTYSAIGLTANLLKEITV